MRALAILPIPTTEVNGREAANLAELAEAVNAAHRDACESVRVGLTHARRAGELLKQAKRQAGYGAWANWVETNSDFSLRTAQAYMRIADGWSELEANTQPAAHLTITEALKALAKPEAGGHGSRIDSEGVRHKTNGTAESKPATHVELLACWRRAPFDARRKFLDNAGDKDVLAALPSNWEVKPQRPTTEAGERVLEILRRIEASLQNIPRIAIAAKSAEQKVVPDLWALAEEFKRYTLREVIVDARCPEEPGKAEAGIPDFLRRKVVPLHAITTDGESVNGSTLVLICCGCHHDLLRAERGAW